MTENIETKTEDKKDIKELKARGKPLPNIGSISSNPLVKANELKKNQLKLREIEEELDNLPLPRTIKNDPEKRKEIANKRKKLGKQKKKLEKILEKQSKNSKEIVFEDEREKMSNLAKTIDYEVKDFKELPVLEFERHKKAVLLKASNHYEDYAKMLTAGIIELSAFFDELPYGGGTQQKLVSSAHTIQNRSTAIFIDQAQRNVDVLKYINPYTALGLSVALPVLSTMASNYMKGKKKKKIVVDTKSMSILERAKLEEEKKKKEEKKEAEEIPQ